MPYPNVPAALTGKMERCVSSVIKQGKAKSSAIAICHKQIVGKGVANAAKKRRTSGKA